MKNTKQFFIFGYQKYLKSVILAGWSKGKMHFAIIISILQSNNNYINSDG